MKFILSLLFSLQLLSAQNYKAVDSIVANYPENFNSISEFSNKIESDFDTDIEKIRAAYFWISNSVFYDYPSANSSRSKSISYSSYEELERYQKRYATRALRRKLAVCEGYSQLLKFTLNQMQIKCEVISGYAKTGVRDIGRITRGTNHAWNAVYINDKWQLIDATWSTGNNESSPNVFEFTDVYFLIAPKDLILTHFPEERQWQLLDVPVSNKTFFYNPIVHYGYYKSGLKLSKFNGLLKSNSIIELEFDAINKNNTYYYTFNTFSRYAEPIEFIEKGNKYITQLPFKIGQQDELIIFNNNEACLSFKILN